MRLTSVCSFLSVACLGLSFLLVGAALAQSDPQVGVWKLNVAKSKRQPRAAPKSATTTIEAAGTGAKFVADQVLADGTTRHWESTSAYDGKDSPVTGNNPDADMIARTRINATTVQAIAKKGWKSHDYPGSVVSADGKTRTVTTTGMNAKGQKVNKFLSYIFDNPARRMSAFNFTEDINESLHAVLLRSNLLTLDRPSVYTYISIGILLLTGLYLLFLLKRKLYDYILVVLLLVGLFLYPGTLSYYGVVLLFVVFQFFNEKNQFGFSSYLCIPITGIAYYLCTFNIFPCICFFLTIIVLKSIKQSGILIPATAEST